MTLLPLKQLFSARLPKLSALNPANAEPAPVAETALTPLPQTPREVLAEIGQELAQARVLRQMSIEDVAARTQIQPHIVRALEQGHLEMLPESVYVRGTIKRFGNCVGIDGAAMSQRMLDWNKATANCDEQPTFLQTHAQTKIQQPADAGDRSRGNQQSGFNSGLPQFKPLYVYLGYGLALVVAGTLVSQLAERTIGDKSAQTSTSSSTSSVRIPSTVVSKPVLPSVKVTIVAKSAAWAQIGVDGVTRFTGNLSPGTQLNLLATKQVTISTNNAGVLWLSQASQPPQAIGKIGEKLHTTVKVSK